MKYTLYKPNPKVTGCAGSFDVALIGQNQETTLFVSMIKQSGWDDQKKRGTFAGNSDDEGKKVNTKLSMTEAGELLASIESGVPFEAFHKFNDDTTIIKFTPFTKKRKVRGKDGDEWYETKAWGFSVIRNSTNAFKLPLDAGEVQVLKVLLKSFIEDCLVDAKAADSQKQAQDSAESAKKPKPAPKVEEEEEDESIPF